MRGKLPLTSFNEVERLRPPPDNISKKEHLHKDLHCATPDFLSRFLTLIDFMRFPLRETAPVVLASAAGRNPGTLRSR
jgi:hypothetical protein